MSLLTATVARGRGAAWLVVSGYIWLVGIWLAAADSVPRRNQIEAGSRWDDLSRPLEDLGPIGRAAALTIAAYAVGLVAASLVVYPLMRLLLWRRRYRGRFTLRDLQRGVHGPDLVHFSLLGPAASLLLGGWAVPPTSGLAVVVFVVINVLVFMVVAPVLFGDRIAPSDRERRQRWEDRHRYR